MRIGQNTASAMGQGAFQLANMLGGIQNRQDDLVTKLARQRIEREKNDAEATTQAKTDEGFRLFQGYISENPNSTPAQRADAALQFGVTGDDRAKNYLSANLGGNRFGESQSENVRKGERFTEKSNFERAKLDKNAEWINARLKQNADQFDRTRDEAERHALEMERIALMNAGNRNESLRLSMLKTGGYSVTDDNYLELKQELAEMNAEYAGLADQQKPMLTDFALNTSIKALSDQKEKLRSALMMYEKGMKPGATVLNLEKIEEVVPPVGHPDYQAWKDKNGKGKGGAVAPPVAPPVIPAAGAAIPAGAQVRTAGNGKRYYVTNNKRIYID